ncbi:PPC domain-containing protein, partial [Xanthomonas fragariae]
LTSNAARSGLVAAAGGSLYYQINVPAGTRSLRVALSGGSGNADLSLRAGALPTETAYSCRTATIGNADSCTLSTPAPGVYYVRVKATLAFSAVNLVATY